MVMVLAMVKVMIINMIIKIIYIIIIMEIHKVNHCCLPEVVNQLMKIPVQMTMLVLTMQDTCVEKPNITDHQQVLAAPIHPMLYPIQTAP